MVGPLSQRRDGGFYAPAKGLLGMDSLPLLRAPAAPGARLMQEGARHAAMVKEAIAIVEHVASPEELTLRLTALRDGLCETPVTMPDSELTAMTWDAAPTGKRGRQPDYSDAAIQTCLTMKELFGMALRQTTGFVECLLHLIDLDWAVPNFSTLSRRQKTLKVNIPFRGSQGPLHHLIDSTGIKVEGEGEWNARKHGGTKRRVWRKIHIGIDEKTLEIRTAELITSDVGDAPTLPELLDQIPPDQEIANVIADGAFDNRKCHDAIAARGAAAIIPPRKNARPWKPDTPSAVAPNESLCTSKRFGRTIWRR